MVFPVIFNPDPPLRVRHIQISSLPVDFDRIVHFRTGQSELHWHQSGPSLPRRIRSFLSESECLQTTLLATKPPCGFQFANQILQGKTTEPPITTHQRISQNHQLLQGQNGSIMHPYIRKRHTTKPTFHQNRGERPRIAMPANSSQLMPFTGITHRNMTHGLVQSLFLRKLHGLQLKRCAQVKDQLIFRALGSILACLHSAIFYGGQILQR
ncbi:hypothetical protein BTIS_0837 [Bifidobacterium tissieri]|uniref:Uncharacterized protein n=1 Tax=Bifidobacterium tissieri TaxID=1630162 RepID=A0A261FHB8_9BIFI|nr:hypothetical protein BTIS_0837 [Bifidobacterium tissieri]